MKMKNLRNRILAAFLAMVMMVTVWMPATTAKADVVLPSATNISFASARDLNFDSTISEEMTASDNVRYYKFSTDSACEMIIRGTTGSRYADTTFCIYDDTMTEAYSVNVGGGFSDSFYLTGGNYYLKCKAFVNVSFIATINTLSESFKETQNKNNDMIDGASSIKVKKTYKGVLASNDEIDYFYYNVPANGTINFSMTNPTDTSLKYSIYDDSLNLVGTNTIYSGRKVSEYIKIQKGEYYLALTKVDSSKKGGSYKFSIDYAVEKPAKPTISSVKISSSKKMTVKWKEVSGITGYELQYSTDKNFKKSVTKKKLSSSKKSVTYSKLTKGKTYYVRMRSYVTVDGKTKYSEWSATKNVKIKK